MYGLGNEIGGLFDDIKAQKRVIRRLRKALKAIVKLEEGYKQRGIGYDLGVHTIVKQALCKD